MSVKQQLDYFKAELHGTACKLLPVSKTHPENKILEAYQAGMKRFGENRVQELVAKAEKLPKDIEWHLIGHLQTNKVKYIAPFVGLIHSVDSLKLLQEIDKQGAKHNRVIPCLLQVYIASEETKFGLDEAEVWQLLRSEKLKAMHHVRIAGLMGMATNTDNMALVRQEFKKLKVLFDEIKTSILMPQVVMEELSMGMSNDYKIAVEEGSTLIRIGSAIFGTR
jgi:pyridoxal phosphate enzyme (YggS family)